MWVRTNFVVFPADGEEKPSSEFHPIVHRVARVEAHRYALPYLLLWTERESATAKRLVLSGHIVTPGCSNHPPAPPIACFYVYLCHHGLDASFAFSDVLSLGSDNEGHHDDTAENEYAKEEFRKRPYHDLLVAQVCGCRKGDPGKGTAVLLVSL